MLKVTSPHTVWLRSSTIDQFRNCIQIMFLLPMPSDEPLHSPASFDAIYIAGIHFAYISCCLVGQASGKLCGL